MNIELKQIHISNFKGIKDLEIDFGKVTNIKADNAKGKTTIFDAFCWVLFGKDSFNNSKFNIRPIDLNGKDIDYIDIEVELTLLIDGKETILKKVQKQKWVKKRGSENSTFEGNVNEYEWNGFPKAEKDFNSSIEEIITDTVFMIVTNPAYFPNMKWKDQRESLMKLVSEIQDKDVIITQDRFLPLVDMLHENSIDAWRDKYAKALREYNKQIDAIPNRIDEVSRNIKEVDYSAEELKLKGLKEKLAEVEEQIEDSSKGFEEILNLQQEIFELKRRIQEIENRANKEYETELHALKVKKDKLDNEFNTLFQKGTTYDSSIESFKKQIEKTKKELEDARVKFKEIDQEVLSDDALFCPTCEQALPEKKADKIAEDFKDSKKNRLLDVRERGINLNKRTEEFNNEVKRLEAEQQENIDRKTESVGEINKVIKAIEEFPAVNFVSIPEWVDLGAKIKDLDYKISTMDTDKGLTDALKTKKINLQNEIDEVKKVLNSKEIIEGHKERVAELQAEQKALSQKVADAEKMIFLFEEFIKAKMDMLSGSINSKFKLVKWKLFDIQINGGLKETCELTLNGVPYASLNSAAKIQAGLDIINTMSAIYNVSAPIFIDNREGVNSIPEVDAQIINLIVTKDQELKVEVAS